MLHRYIQPRPFSVNAWWLSRSHYIMKSNAESVCFIVQEWTIAWPRHSRRIGFSVHGWHPWDRWSCKAPCTFLLCVVWPAWSILLHCLPAGVKPDDLPCRIKRLINAVLEKSPRIANIRLLRVLLAWSADSCIRVGSKVLLMQEKVTISRIITLIAKVQNRIVELLFLSCEIWMKWAFDI